MYVYVLWICVSLSLHGATLIINKRKIVIFIIIDKKNKLGQWKLVAYIYHYIMVAQEEEK